MNANEAAHEAYYAAKAKAYRADAVALRMHAAASRINPVVHLRGGAFYEEQADSYERMASELEQGEAA